MKEQIIKSIQYHRATFEKQTAKTLQDYLRDAFGKCKSTEDKAEKLLDKPEIFRIFNINPTKDNMQFGDLILFEKGKHHQAIESNFKMPTLSVGTVSPPTADGKEREFLEAILYYGSFDNHLVLMQSRALRSKDLENALNWFLKEKSGVLQDNTVILEAAISENIKSKLKDTPIKKVKFGTPLHAFTPSSTTESSNDKSIEVSERKVTKSAFGITNNRAVEAIKSLISPTAFASLNLDKLPENSELKLMLEIQHTSRKQAPASDEFMANLATAFRHSDPEDFSVELRGKSIIRGDKLFVRDSLSVTCYNGQVAPNDLFQQMSNWLKRKLEEGVV